MNLLLVGNHFADAKHNPNVWDDLATHLLAAGHHVITTSGRHNKVLRLADMLLTIWQNRQQYQLAQVDVFSGQAFTWALLSAKWLKRLKKPLILSLHGGNLPAFAVQHPRSVRELLSLADAVTAPSPYLLEAMHPYRRDIVLIPNALDITHYPFILRERPKPFLTWLRAFHKIYNPEMAIKVLHILHGDLPETRLMMVGPDKGDGSLQATRALARQLGVESAVVFAGSVPKADVPGWLNKNDILLNTTNYDNTPVSVMEALACGLCVVTTNVGGIPWMVQDQEEALLVPPNDPEAMAAAVRRIFTEPGLAEKLSVNARSRAEKLDWSSVFPVWQDLLQGIKNGK